ncbi:protein eceriferum 3 [Gossypium australe]|uniref:Protein eceriferum 3 n=1 Tax=Gossypium australe TaxID=47621 RepID=A0A5B6W551_9ROSI|nr:protein eceriferum 3 [Gossypium australe]
MVKGMKTLNFCREFELEKMKESETIKEYSDRLLVIVNNERLICTDFYDSMIVQKLLVTLLKDLKTHEQRRHIRQGGTIKGALQAKSPSCNGGKNKKKM